MYTFYAMLSRMKHINRWGLMKSLSSENVAEHSQQTAMIAHALAVIENKLFNGDFNPDRAGMIALYHEVGEVLTGDLPTPVKYYSEEICAAYKRVETEAENRLLSSLPDFLFEQINPLVKNKDCREYELIKCADKLAAYVKCAEEVRFGNGEFRHALKQTGEVLSKLSQTVRSVKYFMDNFVEAYFKTLDELML